MARVSRYRGLSFGITLISCVRGRSGQGGVHPRADRGPTDNGKVIQQKFTNGKVYVAAGPANTCTVIVPRSSKNAACGDMREVLRALPRGATSSDPPQPGTQLSQGGACCPRTFVHRSNHPPRTVSAQKNPHARTFMEVMGRYPPPIWGVLAIPPPGEPRVACLDLGCGRGYWYVSKSHLRLNLFPSADSHILGPWILRGISCIALASRSNPSTS